MFIVDHVNPEQAQGDIARIYSVFPEAIGVPAPMQLLSVSPELLKMQAKSLGYFMHHPNLEAPLLPALRYLGASRAGYDYCMGLNRGMLERQGMDQPGLAAITDDPQQRLWNPTRWPCSSSWPRPWMRPRPWPARMWTL